MKSKFFLLDSPQHKPIGFTPSKQDFSIDSPQAQRKNIRKGDPNRNTTSYPPISFAALESKEIIESKTDKHSKKGSYEKYLPRDILEPKDQFSFDSLKNSSTPSKSQQKEMSYSKNQRKEPSEKSVDLSGYLMGKTSFSPQNLRISTNQEERPFQSIEDLVEKSFQRRSGNKRKEESSPINFGMGNAQQLNDLKAKVLAYYQKEKKGDDEGDKQFIKGIRGKLQSLSNKMEGLTPKPQKQDKSN